MFDVRRHPVHERVIGRLLLACGVLSALTTLGIVVVLITQSLGFFAEVSLLQLFGSARWSPGLLPQSFGILPLLHGTLLVAAGAALIALPAGLGTAIYLSEYASVRRKRIVEPALEILAGIPTVVYGYFAVVAVVPSIRFLFPNASIFNAASAAIVVGIMIMPMVSSMSAAALNAVPRSMREAAYGLGATKFEVSARVVVPAGFPGIAASFILAISRAIAETMVVTLAAGATPKVTLDLFESIQTMTAYIVQVSLGGAPSGTIEYRAIFAVALFLFLMTLGLNLLGQRITNRFRKGYR